MNSKCKLKCGVCHKQLVSYSKDWIFLYLILHHVQLEVQNNIWASLVWVKQNQYSGISSTYMLSKLGNLKRNTAVPWGRYYKESLKNLTTYANTLPVNGSIFNLYSELEAYGSLLETHGTVVALYMTLKGSVHLLVEGSHESTMNRSDSYCWS